MYYTVQVFVIVTTHEAVTVTIVSVAKTCRRDLRKSVIVTGRDYNCHTFYHDDVQE